MVGSPIEETVYAGVSATYADSPSPGRALQLYYGPSSNFPMIQHINQRLLSKPLHASPSSPSPPPPAKGRSEGDSPSAATTASSPSSFSTTTATTTTTAATTTTTTAIAAAPPSTAASDPSEEVDDGLERFRYRPIFFSKYSDKQDVSYPGNSGGGGGLVGRAAGSTPSTRIDDSDLLFLPHGLAADFLSKFLMTLQKHMPFVDPASAEDRLAVLYGRPAAAATATATATAAATATTTTTTTTTTATHPPSLATHTPTTGRGRELDIGERAILLAVLAVGATLTEHAATWGETLYRRARALADELDDVVNVQVCQLGLLLSHYNSIAGKPNSVYILLGMAMRKALAAGLHKEVLSCGRKSVDCLTVQERRLTFWSIYIFEVSSYLAPQPTALPVLT